MHRVAARLYLEARGEDNMLMRSVHPVPAPFLVLPSAIWSAVCASRSVCPFTYSRHSPYMHLWSCAYPTAEGSRQDVDIYVRLRLERGFLWLTQDLPACDQTGRQQKTLSDSYLEYSGYNLGGTKVLFTWSSVVGSYASSGFHTAAASACGLQPWGRDVSEDGNEQTNLHMQIRDVLCACAWDHGNPSPSLERARAAFFIRPPVVRGALVQAPGWAADAA